MTMESCRAVKPRKKSAIPGVTVKQFVGVVPKGCSMPDFERKPVTLTLQEGKNAMFRAVVKGEPAPEVIWKRSKEEMNNPDKYQMSFNDVTDEHTLQINRLTAEDTDLYHCLAVNEYGEAACAAGLKVIQASFKRKAKPFPTEPQEDLKKELQDFRKMLRKRTPLQKKEVDMEQVWHLLLNADRKDYEKICLKYGIVDFRGMLRKLQQMKKAREDRQLQYIYSVTNLKHIKINKEGKATFHLELDLKNPESKIYLYKDGQMINYAFNDDKAKHCLRRAGNKYNFTINQLQLEDAGVYQIKVEDVDVFTTELEADSARGKWSQAERDGTDQTGRQTDKSLFPDEEGAKELLQGEGLGDQNHLKSTSMGKDGQYGSNQDDREHYGSPVGQDGLPARVGKDGRMVKGQFSDTGTGGISATNGTKFGGVASNEGGLRGKIHGQDLKLGGAGIGSSVAEGDLNYFHVKGSVLGVTNSGVQLEERRGLGSLHGRDSMLGGAGLGGSGELGSLHGMEGSSDTGHAGLGGAGGLGNLYRKDGIQGRAGGSGSGQGDKGSLYVKDAMLGGASVGIGLDGAGGMRALDDRGATLGASVVGDAGFSTAGVMLFLSGKDGMKGGASAESTGVGSLSSFYHKAGMFAGAGAHDAGTAGASSMGSLHGKDSMIGAVEAVAGGDEAVIGRANAGLGGAGGVRSFCSKDGMLDGTGAGTGVSGDGLGSSTGAVGPLCGNMGILGGADPDGAGSDSGFGGTRGMMSLYGKNGMVGEAGSKAGYVASESSPWRMGTLSSKDTVLGVAGAGSGAAGGLGTLYGKGGGLHASLGGARGEDYLCGKGDKLHGAGTDSGSTRRMGPLCGEDTVLGEHGAGGAGSGLAGAGGVLCLSGEDAKLGRTGASGGLYGAWGGDVIQGGAGTGSAGARIGLGGACARDGKDGTLADAGRAAACGLGALNGKDCNPSGAGAGSADTGGIGTLYGFDNIVSEAESGAGAAGLRGAGGVESFCGSDGKVGGTSAGAGVDRADGLDSIYSKASVLGGAGPGTGGEYIGAWGMCSLGGRDSPSDGAVTSGREGGVGDLGSPHDRDPTLGGAAVDAQDKLRDDFTDEREPHIHSGGSLSYNQVSGQHGKAQADARRGQMPSQDASGPSAEENVKNRNRKRKGPFFQDETRDCHFDKGLSEVCARQRKLAVLSYSLSNDQVEAIWFQDESKIIGLDEVSSEKDGLTCKLITHTVKDSYAGKYEFDHEGVKNGESIFVEDPPNVDKALLEKLMKEPMVVKAGQNAMVKIPFKGRKPVRATWLKDGDKLMDDTRIHIDKADNFTRLSIFSTNRKDCGDYKVKLKNESGALEASLKLEVIDKPQKPIGPIEVVDSSTTGITIRWKPPKDDGGKPVQSYIIERQQVGRKTWVTLGETDKNNSTFTTDNVEQDKSYCFRVRAVNAEGTSEALESDEVMAAAKALLGPPAPPKIVSASKEFIKLSWAAPSKPGNSRILGYIVEKRKKGSNIWTPITELPIKDRKWVVTDLEEGLQYEFRVAAVSATGTGKASASSDAVFVRDPMKPPGRVRDVKVTHTDYTSITLAWVKPSSEEGGSAKGYMVEKQSSDSLKWTQCNTVPTEKTTFTVKGLQARKMYLLRVTATNEGGAGETVALNTYIQAVPPIVSPKFLRDATLKNFMNIKVGGCIRVHIPFEGTPTPEVIWLKDGLPLPSRAMVSTRDGLSQLLIPSAEFSDSGLYTIILQNDWRKKESFSFQVHVADIPQSPGPIHLQEKVLNSVTVMWGPSPTEKWESNLYYVVMKSDSSKGSWQVVGDLIYTNKFTITKLIPGQGYYFRVVAKNYMGTSDPSETVQPWIIPKEKDKFKVRLPKYRRVNQNVPPRFLVQLKPHVVTPAFDCCMSCAVSGYPKPKITWYKDGRNLSEDPTFFSTNDFGVCCLVIPAVTKRDEGEYKVEATNELGHVASKAMLIIKEPSF